MCAPNAQTAVDAQRLHQGRSRVMSRLKGIEVQVSLRPSPCGAGPSNYGVIIGRCDPVRVPLECEQSFLLYAAQEPSLDPAAASDGTEPELSLAGLTRFLKVIQ